MHQPEEPQQLGSEIFNMYLNITFSPAMILFCECLEGLKSVNTGSQKHITKTNPYPQTAGIWGILWIQPILSIDFLQ